MLTHEKLLELVVYDQDTGIFTCREDTRYRKAGTVMNLNSWKIIRPGATPVRVTDLNVCGFGNFRAGRLAYFYMTGEWPKKPYEIDHSDNDGWNQKWENIRIATRSQNQANTRRYKSNSTGFKCVFPSGRKNKPFRTQIQKDKQRISLGYFETAEAAHAAYVAAAAVHHGAFARQS